MALCGDWRVLAPDQVLYNPPPPLPPAFAKKKKTFKSQEVLVMVIVCNLGIIA